MAKGVERLLGQIFKQSPDPLGFKDLKPELQKQLVDLGLDPADRAVSRGRETEHVTRSAEKIFQNIGDVEELRAMLATHGLNDNVYDAEKNPTGILLPSGTAQRSRNLVIACALYRLSGVSLALFAQFLGVSQYYSRMSSYYSPALDARVAEVSRERLRFPLQHARDFPMLSALEKEIREHAGLELGSLFEGDAIPPLVSDSKQLSLVPVLRALALAACGYSRSEIARKLEINQSTVSTLLHNKRKSIQLSLPAQQMLQRNK